MDVPLASPAHGITGFRALGSGTDLGLRGSNSIFPHAPEIPMKAVEITLALSFAAAIAVVALSVMAGNLAI